MKYKVIPCINSNNHRKGWKIVTDDNYEHEYCPDNKHFTVYYNYHHALEHCEHLNGESKVFRNITQSSWGILSSMVREWRKG